MRRNASWHALTVQLRFARTRSMELEVTKWSFRMAISAYASDGLCCMCVENLLQHGLQSLACGHMFHESFVLKTSRYRAAERRPFCVLCGRVGQLGRTYKLLRLLSGGLAIQATPTANASAQYWRITLTPTGAEAVKPS